MTPVLPTDMARTPSPAPSGNRYPSRPPWPPQATSGPPSIAGHRGAVVLYFITSALSAYNNVLVGEIALYLIALAGLSLLTGTSGQISLGQGAFMAVGAYRSPCS